MLLIWTILTIDCVLARVTGSLCKPICWPRCAFLLAVQTTLNFIAPRHRGHRQGGNCKFQAQYQAGYVHSSNFA